MPHLAERTQRDVLIFPEDHDAPMPLDFFVWAIRGEGRTIVARHRLRRGKRRAARPALAPLADRRARAASASMPADGEGRRPQPHALGPCRPLGRIPEGALPSPGCRDGLSAPAAACATSRCAVFEVEQVTTAVRHVFAERVKFHDGTAEIAPGITLHLVGGHSGGMQMHARADRARLGRARQRRRAFLVQHPQAQPVRASSTTWRR